MSEILFFPKTVHREVKIRTYTGLVGKAPEKAKRLKIAMSMPLSGRTAVGMPGWLGDAFEFASKTNDSVTKHIDFPGVDVEFSSDDLFSKPTKAPKAKLGKFVVIATGPSEDREIELQFMAYVGFATDLHKYIGQMIGDGIWARFDVIGGGEETGTGRKPSQDDEEDEDDEPLEDEPTDEEAKLFGQESGYMGAEHDADFKSPGSAPAKKGGRKPKVIMH